MPTEQSTPEYWVEQYGDFLFSYAIKRLRDENAAEEVVQETFLNGIKYYSQYTGTGSQQAWLTGILKRKIIDFIRETKQAPTRSARRTRSFQSVVRPTRKLPQRGIELVKQS